MNAKEIINSTFSPSEYYLRPTPQPASTEEIDSISKEKNDIVNLIESHNRIFITVDGPDGCGKATVTKELRQIFEQYINPNEILMVEPPFYDTKSGEIIKKYLQNGPQYIRDRRVISELYAMDRNLWYGAHMDKITSARVVIFNRSWISNLLYQTTKAPAGGDDTFNDVYGVFDVRLNPLRKDGNSMDMDTELMFSKKSFAGMWALAFHDELIAAQYPSFTTDTEEQKKHIRDTLRAFCLNYRHKMITSMMNAIYAQEIQPWPSPANPHGPETFLDSGRLINFILYPSCKDWSKMSISESMHILNGNLLTRYGNDEQKKDRNEQSDFQANVLENIHFVSKWLHSGFCLPTNNWKYNVMMAPRLYFEPDYSVDYFKHYFDFDIVQTLQSTKVDTHYSALRSLYMTTQKPPAAIAYEIFDRVLIDLL